MRLSSIADCVHTIALPVLSSSPSHSQACKSGRVRTKSSFLSSEVLVCTPSMRQMSGRQCPFYFLSFYPLPSAVHTTVRPLDAQGSGEPSGSEPPPKQRRKPGRVPVSCAECRRCVVLPTSYSTHGTRDVSCSSPSPDSS